MISSSLIPFVSAAATLLLCGNAWRMGHAFGLIDNPKAKAHAQHDAETPLVGGLAILAPWVAAAIAYAKLAPGAISPTVAVTLGQPLLGLVIFFLALGALDDRHHLSARARLWISVLAYLTITMQAPEFRVNAISVSALGLHVPLGHLSVPFTVLCLVALTNAVNMADGRNSLVIGLCYVWVSTLLFRLPEFARPMMLGLIAALFVAGWFNWRGRLFLGDAGAYALACLIGFWSIWASNQPIALGGLSTSQLATLFAIPAFDMFRLIALRLYRGVSAMSPDNDHLHHRLDRFCGWRVGFVVYLLMVALPILAAMSQPQTGHLGPILATMLYALVWAMTRRAASSPATSTSTNV